MTVLNTSQDAFLRAFARSPLQPSFHLTGGTALAAFYLQHRFSEDLDFFTGDPAIFAGVRAEVDRLCAALGGRFELERSFQSFLDGEWITAKGDRVKMDFAVDSPYRLEPRVLQKDYGLYIDGALDIACNKLSALFDRAEAKDFVDVYFIFHEMIPSDTLIKRAGEKHVGLDPYLLARMFLRVRDIRTLPKMIKPLSLQLLQEYFLDLAKRMMDQLR